MTTKAQLKAKIEELLETARDEAVAGSMRPEDAAAVRADYKVLKMETDKMIDDLFKNK